MAGIYKITNNDILLKYDKKHDTKKTRLILK